VAGPDEIIHQSTRLRIMAVLNAAERGERFEFTRLKALLKASDGNLGAHIGTLEKAGYLTVEKDFVAKKPRTRVSLTAAGKRAFEHHVSYLREVLDGDGG
jgi:DNA-binding MarR family transcriptional regulator